MCRVEFSKTSAYLVEVQEIGEEFHLHCQVYNWSKTTLRELYKELASVKQLAKSVGYNKMYSISPNPKFCRLFGGVSLGGDSEYEVMIWDLK
jgi:hypothetical protein